jgi:DNA-binding IclR family transcriptional regulator
MPGLLKHAPDSALLLCSLYGETVLCIHHEGPSALAYKGTSVAISRPRGLPFPLFSGAASLAILAHLPGHRIKSLYVRHHTEVARLGLGSDWTTFRKGLLLIRKSGFAFSAGAFNPLLGGVAVPILAKPDGYIVGSLTLVMPSPLLTPDRQVETASRLRRAASEISDRMADGELAEEAQRPGGAPQSRDRTQPGRQKRR